MAQIHDQRIKFKQSVSADVTGNRVRIRPANTPFEADEPFQDFGKPTPEADGFSYIKLSDVNDAKGKEGKYDVHVTALDGVGNESDPLEIDNATFDLSPPEAPTAGSIV